MLKLCRITKLKVFFPVLVYVFNFALFEFSAAILEKGLFLEVKLDGMSMGNVTLDTFMDKKNETLKKRHPLN